MRILQAVAVLVIAARVLVIVAAILAQVWILATLIVGLGGSDAPAVVVR